VNVDAVIFQSDNRMAWDALVRDHLGILKLSCQESIDGIQIPELAEAMVVRQALKIISDKGFRNISLV
jgi:hypothetical protein